MKIGFILVGFAVLAACEPVDNAPVAVGSDSYFATNIGRRVGQAEALAAKCAGIRLNAATVHQYKTAICTARGEVVGCSLPAFEAAKQQLYAQTMVSLRALSPEQVCVYTRAEAANDSTLSSFLLGADIPRAAVVLVPTPTPKVEEPEPVVDVVPGPI